MRDPALYLLIPFSRVTFYSFINLVAGKVLLISESMYYLCSLTSFIVLKAL